MLRDWLSRCEIFCIRDYRYLDTHSAVAIGSPLRCPKDFKSPPISGGAANGSAEIAFESLGYHFLATFLSYERTNLETLYRKSFRLLEVPRAKFVVISIMISSISASVRFFALRPSTVGGEEDGVGRNRTPSTCIFSPERDGCVILSPGTSLPS